MKTWLETIIEMVGTAALADFVAGLVHWLEDAYVREDTPLIGTVVGRPNVIHHHLPRYFTKFNWWHSSRDLLLIAGVIVLAAWGLGLLTWQVWLFAVMSANANEVHKWAHRSRLENGRVITFLQNARILQTVRHHAIHHTNPKNCHYCPITNLVNPVLDGIHFWGGLERLLAHTAGLRRRPDTSLPNAPVPAWVEALRQEMEAKKPAMPAPAVAAPTCAKCPGCKHARAGGAAAPACNRSMKLAFVPLLKVAAKTAE